MDWFLDTADRKPASALRPHIGEYLHRHATDAGAADDAELVVEELLGNAVRHRRAGVGVGRLVGDSPGPARNADGASEYLEERIALGDPECRVVVSLGPAAPHQPASHRYPAPQTT
jgi:hypothetical protein